jgi:hypothetical protein
MAWRQDMRRERHVSRTRAVYAGEHGASKDACHMDKDKLLYLYTVYFSWQVRHGIEPILDLAWARSGSDSL